MHQPLEIKAVDIESMHEKTTNLYETIALLSKRSRQIAAQQKLEMNREILSYVAPDREGDSIVNEQQLAVAKKYERISQPSLIAFKELQEDKLYYRYASENGE